jgi:hypothetical protein
MISGRRKQQETITRNMELNRPVEGEVEGEVLHKMNQFKT